MVELPGGHSKGGGFSSAALEGSVALPSGADPRTGQRAPTQGPAITKAKRVSARVFCLLPVLARRLSRTPGTKKDSFQDTWTSGGCCVSTSWWYNERDHTQCLGSNGVGRGWSYGNAMVGEFRIALLLVFTMLVLAVISDFDCSSLARIAITLAMFLGRSLSSFRSMDAPFTRPHLLVQPSRHGSLDVRRTPSRTNGSFILHRQPVWSMPSGSLTSRAGATSSSRSPLNLRSQRDLPSMRGGRIKFRAFREERVLVSTGNVEGDAVRYAKHSRAPSPMVGFATERWLWITVKSTERSP